MKWPGGKSGELPGIAAAAPDLRGRFIDPFVGGGAVLLAVPVEVGAFANDICPELIALFQGIGRDDRSLRRALERIATTWDAFGQIEDALSRLEAAFRSERDGERDLACGEILRQMAGHLEECGPSVATGFRDRLTPDVTAKMQRIRATQVRAGKALDAGDLRANLEGSVRATFYYVLRDRYNEARRMGSEDPDRLSDFFFLREYAYAAMFRFNGRGDFNVPYGGVSYNRKSLWAKLAAAYADAMGERLRNTEWRCGDFEAFLRDADPADDDLVFIDPPYDSEFSDYDNRPFVGDDQIRLAALLSAMPCRVMVVIKDTPFVRGLYEADHWRVTVADKTYMWTIKSRNDRAAVHLTITNY